MERMKTKRYRGRSKRSISKFKVGDIIEKVDKITWKVLSEGRVIKISKTSVIVEFISCDGDTLTLALNKTGNVNQCLEFNYFPK